MRAAGPGRRALEKRGAETNVLVAQPRQRRKRDRPASFRTTLAMPESEALASTDRRGSRHSQTVHQTSVDKTYAVGKLAFACRLQALPLGPSSTQGLRWGGCQGLRAGDKGGTTDGCLRVSAKGPQRGRSTGPSSHALRLLSLLIYCGSQVTPSNR